MPLIASGGDTSSGESDKNVPLAATIDEFLAALIQRNIVSAIAASSMSEVQYEKAEEGSAKPGLVAMNYPARSGWMCGPLAIISFERGGSRGYQMFMFIQDQQ